MNPMPRMAFTGETDMRTLWQAGTMTSDKDVRTAYGNKAEQVDVGIWLIELPEEIEVEIRDEDYAEWTDRYNIKWEIEG